MALERMKNCASVLALAEQLGVHRTVLCPLAAAVVPLSSSGIPRKYAK